MTNGKNEMEQSQAALLRVAWLLCNTCLSHSDTLRCQQAPISWLTAEQIGQIWIHPSTHRTREVYHELTVSLMNGEHGEYLGPLCKLRGSRKYLGDNAEARFVLTKNLVNLAPCPTKHTHTHACMHAHTHTIIYICIYMHKHTHTHVHACADTQTYPNLTAKQRGRIKLPERLRFCGSSQAQGWNEAPTWKQKPLAALAFPACPNQWNKTFIH